MKYNAKRGMIMNIKEELLEEIVNKSGIKTNGLDEAMDKIIDMHSNDEVGKLLVEYFNILREERYNDINVTTLDESLEGPDEWVDDDEFKDLVGEDVYNKSIEVWKEKGLIR